MKDLFLWHDSYWIGNVYFSHANPFIYGDWSYLEKNQNLLKGFNELSKKKAFAGIFGHSHRQLFIGNKKKLTKKFTIVFNISYCINNICLNLKMSSLNIIITF